MRLMAENQFDTIYHEHFSYFSFITAVKIFAAHGSDGLRCRRAADARRLAAHLCPACRGRLQADRRAGPRTAATREERRRLQSTWTLRIASASRSRRRSASCSTFLIEAKRDGKTVVGYGAPGKGNTLLNYCGIRDRFPRLHGGPQSVQAGQVPAGHAHPDLHIRTRSRRPSRTIVLILPWNLKREIIEQHSYIRDWGGRFVVPIPEVQVIG